MTIEDRIHEACARSGREGITITSIIISIEDMDVLSKARFFKVKDGKAYYSTAYGRIEVVEMWHRGSGLREEIKKLEINES